MPNLLSEFSITALAEELLKRRQIKDWLNIVSNALSETGKCIALSADFDPADLVGVDLYSLQGLAKDCASLREKLEAAKEWLDAPAG